MKVFLQDIETGAYFQAPGEWTFHREDASDFKNVLDALDLSQNFPGRGLEIVLTFNDGQHDIRFSVGSVPAAQSHTTAAQKFLWRTGQCARN